MGLRAILFDLDGTLVDSAPAIAAALSVLRRRNGAEPIGAATVRPWISLGAPELVRLGLAEAADSPDGDLVAFRQALASLPTPADSLYPDVGEVLAALQDGGLKLAIVTNKPEDLSRKLLDELGLGHRFAAVVGGDSAAQSKPEAAPLRLALREVGAHSDEAVFVGDSPVDAAAAAALGMPFYLFEGGYGAAECADRAVFARFASHRDLLTLLSEPPSRSGG